MKLIRPGYILLLALSVFLAYLLNHSLGFPSGTSAWAFWLANGVAVAFLMRRPWREWPLLALAMLVGKQGAWMVLSGGQLWNAAQYQLGLATVARVAQRFGGSTRANSEHGRGTEIEIVLPRTQAERPGK